MKNKKLIGLASLMLVLGVTGCPKTDDSSTNNDGTGPTTTECTKHTWGEKVTIKEATCTEAGQTQRTCTVCGKKEDPKTVKALGHSFVDDATGGVAPTCTEAGSKNQTCSRCGAKNEGVSVPALGHEWVDDETGRVEPTCTEPGSKNQHCSRCDATNPGVEIPATGHSYGDWATVEGKAPTCEGKGEEQRVCSACNNIDTREVAALGHKFELIDADAPTETGKATVRMYKCVNGCNQTSLGFRANEVTEGSANHLSFTEPNEKGEVGASFWGRPIGNSLSLDPQSGDSKNRQNNECVYCSTETGDYFEYVFNLTSTQAEQLATCRCYCDAKPANYLSGDFWAYNASADDWTPGYYIDGKDEHVEKDENNQPVMVEDHARCERDSSDPGAGLGEENKVKMGKRITDYRYVLYVDDDIKDFDKDTSVPVEGSGTNTVRKEYELPYTFHLHAGENKISLRMAGGYRSTFYNFTFRPYVEKTQITVAESELTVEAGLTAPITGASQEGVTYTSSDETIATVDATGVKAGDAVITVAKEGNFKPAKVAVKVTPSTAVHVDTWGEATPVAAEGEGCAYDKYACTGAECNNEKYVISVNNCTVVDWKDGTFGEGKKLSKSSANAYDGNAIATLKFNADKAMDGRFYALGGVDVAGNQKYGFHSGKNGNTPVVELADNATNTVFKINDKSINVPVKTYGECGIGDNKTLAEGLDAAGLATAIENGEAALIDLGDASLKAGLNTFTMAATNSFGLRYYKIVFIGAEHVHNFGETGVDLTEGATDAAVKKYECGCGVVKYEIDVKTAQMQVSGAWKNNPDTGVFKLDGDGSSASFTFALPKGFVGKMYQRAYMDSYNSQKSKSMFYATNDTCNIEVKINDAAIDFSSLHDVTFGQVFGDELNGSNSTVKDVYLGDVTLAAANTISYKRVKTLNQLVSAFVFIGTEVDA